eukprot:TRINITY_DN40337_c0_g1_i1.p1 TRINITY_DN40337_c0_g1~~TRINITY_DN40337_c0_g1_i1.p1  ORF type:complete len:534 (-),score=120.07 TRINITY_DN40337_c0_g1_i1:92-1693(-)
MDVFLLVLVLSVLAFALVMNTRLLLHYQMPEDSGFASSVLCKAIIVLSMTLAWMVNLLLPVDVRNSRPEPGFLDMQVIWSAAFITLAVFIVLVVPAAMFYHEVEGDDTVKRKRRHVIFYLVLTLIFAAGVVAISFPFLSKATLPVVEYACEAWQDADAPYSEDLLCKSGKQTEVQIQVGFQIYLMAALCFVGWFFFSIFGGVGLSAAPLEMILAFVDRPRPIDEGTYRQRRQIVGRAANVLLQRAEELQERDGQATEKQGALKGRRFTGLSGWKAGKDLRKVRSDYNRFKCDVLLLEEEFERLQISKFNKGESIAVSVIKLIIGIIFALMSIAWVLHIIIYVLVPQATGGTVVSVFLNGIFTACETSGLYPLGVALYAAFNFYLLLCVVKGCMKLGMRVAFLISIHPMRAKNTPLNSILFNVEMLLISSAAIVQFSQTCFSDYARLTDADVIFSAQIKRLEFYRFFFEHNVFIIIILSLFLLALIYFLVRPRDTATVQFSQKADKKLAKMIGAEGSTPKTPISNSKTPISNSA